MNVLSKTNIPIENIWISIFLRLIPESFALKLLNIEKKRRAKKGVINHSKSFFRTKSNGKIRVLFILWKPQIWNSQKSVYEAALNNPKVDVNVLIMPDETILSDGSILTSYDYYKKICPNAIEAIKDGKIYDINNLNPDIIIRQSPYDNVFPKQYSMANLAKIAKTCYIPYNYNYTPNHLNIEYNSDLLSDVYAIFSDCITNYNYCLKEHYECYPDIHLFYYGFPRFDIVRKMQNRKCERKVFTWIPRWNTDTVNNDGTSFFKYKDLLVDYFNSHPDLSLIIRPHPNMFKHFIKIGLMSEKDVKYYLDKVNCINNVCMDDNMDYLQTFEKTDVLIADMSSINYEFYLTGRPIIFCGDTSHFNEETRIMYNLMYNVSDWQGLKGWIEKIINGYDPSFKERRLDILKAFNELPDNIGDAIVKKLVEISRQT